MLRRCRFLGVALACGLMVWAFAAARPPQPPPSPPRPEPVHAPDLIFASPGGEALRLDLAMPAEGDGPFPAIVCLHGGGWISGDRKQMAHTIAALARRGYVAIAPDYRLAPAHRFPAQIEDCKAAVRWLRANASAYKVDVTRIGTVGIAAGGHLACLLGVASAEDGLEGAGGNPDYSSGVQAVVSFFGPTDLTKPVWGKAAVEQNLVPLLGGTQAAVPDAYRRASPATYAGRRSAPPFLFLHGATDQVVPASQSVDLAEKLRQAGSSAKVVLLDGEGHTLQGEQLRNSIAEMLTFFDEKLKQ